MKRLILPFALVAFVFCSCKKEEITEVRQVDQAFSAVYTILPGDWVSNDGGYTYSADLNIPELDHAIYQDGAVLTYLSFSGTSYYEALPQVFDGITYGAIHGDGFVSIDISALSGNLIDPPGQSISAKIILIDATRLALRPNINFRNLKEVERAFGIH